MNNPSPCARQRAESVHHRNHRRTPHRQLGRALIASALLALTVSCGRGPPASARHPMLGKPVSITLPTDGGEQISVPAPDRRKLVLEFFAPNCESCRTRLPALVDRRELINARGARLVLVALLADHESIDQARSALHKWGVQWPFLVDSSGASRPYLGISKAPSALLVDGKGKLLWSAPADATADDVIAAIR